MKNLFAIELNICRAYALCQEQITVTAEQQSKRTMSELAELVWLKKGYLKEMTTIKDRPKFLEWAIGKKVEKKDRPDYLKYKREFGNRLRSAQLTPVEFYDLLGILEEEFKDIVIEKVRYIDEGEKRLKEENE